MNTKSNRWIILILICIGLTGVFGVPYLTRGFYNVFQDAMGLSHVQIGFLMSIYGTLSMVTYVIGGWVVDRTSTKKMLILGCVGNAVLGAVVLMYPSFIVLAFSYGAYAITSNLAFFPAMIKAIRGLGDSSEQGKMFGFKEAFYGLFGIIIGFIVIAIGSGNANDYTQYRYLVILYSAMTLIPAVGLSFMYKDSDENSKHVEKINTNGIDGFKKILKMKHTWLVAISIFTCYFVYSGLAYTSPYMVDVYGTSNEFSSLLGIFRQYFASIVMCFIFGFIADKLESSIKVVNYSFYVFLILLISLIIIPADKSMMIPAMVMILLLTMFACGVRGVYYAEIDEAGFPMELTGTVTGIISFIAFTPDAFYYSLMGSIIDNSIAKGNVASGYHTVFIISIVVTVVGIICGRILYKSIKKDKEKLEV